MITLDAEDAKYFITI